METFNINLPSGNFRYSGAKVENLKSSEYTVAHIAFDESGSTNSFAQDMNECTKTIIKALNSKKNSRLDNMMLSVNCFGTNVREFHGFKEVRHCNPADYENMYQPGGRTSLNDATIIGIESVGAYGRELEEQGFKCNAVIFILTDGCDCGSVNNEKQIRESLEKVVKEECLESLTTVLVGINAEEHRQRLEDFKENCGLTGYKEIKDVSEESMLELGGFVTQSISSTSQSLNTGQPVSLTF